MIHIAEHVAEQFIRGRVLTDHAAQSSGMQQRQSFADMIDTTAHRVLAIHPEHGQRSRRCQVAQRILALRKGSADGDDTGEVLWIAQCDSHGGCTTRAEAGQKDSLPGNRKRARCRCYSRKDNLFSQADCGPRLRPLKGVPLASQACVPRGAQAT